MGELNRRDLMISLGSAGAAALLSSCAIPMPEQRPYAGKLVDIHAHLFNATDLPAAGFIKTVFLSHYPEQGFVQAMDLRASGVVDALVDLFVHIVTGASPTAREEIRVLRGVAEARAEHASSEGAERLVSRRVASYLVEPRLQSGVGSAVVRGAIIAAGTDGSTRLDSGLTEISAQEIALKAYRSDFDIGVYLKWFGLFTRYRYSLADELARDHARLGYKATLVAPAMVDFAKWFDIRSDVLSPLEEQVEVMGLVARRPGGPRLRGYVSFDPLREALHRAGRPGSSPLKLVEHAIRDHGFAGIKLYPPMGFKPWKNGNQPYPKQVTDFFGGRLETGRALDAALADVYDLAVSLDAPIIAHAADSNAAGLYYGRRGDPAHWIPVWENWPRLRVCLAHFGGFETISEGAPAGSQLPESSWEYVIGAYVARHPEAGIFADLSSYTEVLKAGPAQRAEIARAFRGYVARFDPEVRHLMFGSDWIMLGNQREHLFYAERLVAFLQKDCGLSDEQLERILVHNAATFLDGASNW